MDWEDMPTNLERIFSLTWKTLSQWQKSVGDHMFVISSASEKSKIPHIRSG